jgi:biopolymer transport protein ExbD
MSDDARKPRADGALAEINITPLIDVMLVLLVIFMLVTPVAQRGLDLHLPRPATPDEPADPSVPLVMTLEGGADGRLLVSLGKTLVGEHELGPALRELFDTAPDKTLFVRVSGPLRYGQVVGAMDTARAAGVERIGLLPRQGDRE